MHSGIESTQTFKGTKTGKKRPKSAGKITELATYNKKSTRLIIDMKNKQRKVNIGKPSRSKSQQKNKV